MGIDYTISYNYCTMDYAQLSQNGRIATVDGCSCRNVVVAIQGHHIANLNLFPAADVAIELLSGIKMLSISMVASKMFMPQKKIKSPKKGNGYRLYYQLQLFYDGLCTVVTEILQRTYGHRGYSQNSGVAMQVHRTGNPNFFLAAEVAIE